jgi:DNA polymerase-1
VIGTLAEKAAAAGFDVAIVTGDKDFFQLVRDGIRVYNPKEEGTWYDAEGVKEKFGVPPELVVDVLALMGDSIDNIKGVPGIGEKGAKELIAQYGSLDNLLAHAGDGEAQAVSRRPAGQRGGGETEPAAGEDSNRRAGRIRRRGAAVSRRFTARSAFQIFNELGFRAFAKEYAPTASSTVKTYRTITTVDDVQVLAGRLRANGRFALRVLTDGPTAMRAASSASRFRPRPGTRITCRPDTARSAKPRASRSTRRSSICGRSSKTRR